MNFNAFIYIQNNSNLKDKLLRITWLIRELNETRSIRVEQDKTKEKSTIDTTRIRSLSVSYPGSPEKHKNWMM